MKSLKTLIPRVKMLRISQVTPPMKVRKKVRKDSLTTHLIDDDNQKIVAE
jgi:hypothetical protein